LAAKGWRFIATLFQNDRSIHPLRLDVLAFADPSSTLVLCGVTYVASADQTIAQLLDKSMIDRSVNELGASTFRQLSSQDLQRADEGQR